MPDDNVHNNMVSQQKLFRHKNENYQNPDGSVTIPEVLVPYCGFDKIMPKK